MNLVRKFIVSLLRLKEIFVVDYEFKRRDRALHLWVRPYKSGCRCPKCDRRCTIFHVCASPRMWRDIPVCGWSVFFCYQPKEIFCPTHGRIQERIPWAEAYARITYRFEYALLVYCQLMTQKAAARLLHVSTSTLSDLLHQSITRLRDGHRIRGLTSIGVDEISYCKGHKYATIVYDLDRSCVVWVGQGKGRDTIDIFFQESLSRYQRDQILWAACDMSEAYIGAIQENTAVTPPWSWIVSISSKPSMRPLMRSARSNGGKHPPGNAKYSKACAGSFSNTLPLAPRRIIASSMRSEKVTAVSTKLGSSRTNSSNSGTSKPHGPPKDS
jgi:hypothetical protein